MKYLSNIILLKVFIEGSLKLEFWSSVLKTNINVSSRSSSLAPIYPIQILFLISKLKFYFFIFLFFLLNSEYSLSQEHKNPPPSLYDLGVGGGYFNIPYYPGSNQMQERALGIPFFIYRGKIFKSGGKEGTRAELYKEKNKRLDVSFSGGFSADSSKIYIRENMPDLDWMGSVGPRWVWRMYKFKSFNGTLKLNIPLRAVYVTDFKKIEDQGFIFHPNFTLNIHPKFWDNLNLFFRFGVISAESRYMNYYYGVKEEYVSSNRPLYEAKSGLQEIHLDTALALSLKNNWRVFFGFEYNNLHMAANKNSPLLLDKDTFTVGVGLIWKMYQSTTKIR
jgi:outer membrane protein